MLLGSLLPFTALPVFQNTESNEQPRIKLGHIWVLFFIIKENVSQKFGRTEDKIQSVVLKLNTFWKGFVDVLHMLSLVDCKAGPMFQGNLYQIRLGYILLWISFLDARLDSTWCSHNVTFLLLVSRVGDQCYKLSDFGRQTYNERFFKFDPSLECNLKCFAFIMLYTGETRVSSGITAR